MLTLQPVAMSWGLSPAPPTSSCPVPQVSGRTLRWVVVSRLPGSIVSPFHNLLYQTRHEHVLAILYPHICVQVRTPQYISASSVIL